MKTKTV